MTTPETANLEAHKREIEQLNKDKKACESEISRLNGELDQCIAELEGLRGRAPAAEQQITNRTTAQTESANAALVDRIQRLEAENRRLRQSKASAAKVRVEEGGSVREQS
jgi:cell division protein FtsB